MPQRQRFGTIRVDRIDAWTAEGSSALPVADLPHAPERLRIALVLGGGNALGAFHAGVVEALAEGGIEPDWVAGTSIGAITGAIVAGNPPDARLGRLRQFWQPATDGGVGWPMPWDMVPEALRRTGAVLETLIGGRPGLFGAIGSSGGVMADSAAGSPALYATETMRRTLARLVDLDRLNTGPVRYTAVAIDVETGDEVVMDTARQPIGVDHIRASAALLTTYPAMEVDGRLLGDGGLAMNLPLDPVLSADDGVPTLCIASDLLPLGAARPRTLGETIGRMQDLTFAAQSRRSIARWQTALDPDRHAHAPAITLAMLAYSDQEQEVAGKAMDFSPQSVRQRWAAGHRHGAALIDRLRSGTIALDRPGLTLV